jgi:hypothetical protein
MNKGGKFQLESDDDNINDNYEEEYLDEEIE